MPVHDGIGHPSRRFLVTWQGPPGTAISSVGVLTFDGNHHFHYLPALDALEGFQPFPNFPDLGAEYTSPVLFPFFATRVMDPRRPDYDDYCTALALPTVAQELDVLARTAGQRQADRVAVVEEPHVEVDGSTSYVFLVRGIRFCQPDVSAREHILMSVSEGDELGVVSDDENEVNRRALLVTTGAGGPLGWIPDALIGYVSEVLARPDARLVVVRRNGPEQPAHLRLVAGLTGSHPADRVPFPALHAEGLVSTRR